MDLHVGISDGLYFSSLRVFVQTERLTITSCFDAEVLPVKLCDLDPL